ncbi:MAG: FapA family protein [Lachnospiraceae bacterium]
MKRNAFFQLVHRKDGIYLKSYPAVDGGMPLKNDDILTYLVKKQYNDIDLSIIKEFVDAAAKEANACVKVIDGTRLPENEYALITTCEDRRMAKLRLYPPSNEGRRTSKADLIDLIKQNGIKYGIIEKNIEIALKGMIYCTDILIAKAKLPVQGSNASIEYFFDFNKTSMPQMAEDGSVNFHKLDMIERVKEGQLLARLTPAERGTDGIDVLGMPLNPAKVTVLSLKHGKNIHLSDDKLEMYSDVSGNVTLVDDTVFVSNVYEVPADVGPSTGDIDYDGSVEVKGNVLTGYTVKASGDITVNGAVEGAVLNAGGKIVLKRGIQGMGKGNMQAEGDIISKFIESSKVTSGGKIISDAIMHSDVVSQDSVQVHGKRGLIAGGKVRSAKRIETKTAGSSMGTQTDLEVGIDPAIIDRYHAIEKEIELLSNEKEKLMQNLQILQKRLKTKGKLDDDKMKILKSNSVRIKEIDEQIEADTQEYESLETELEKNAGGGKIIVEDIAYPGVKLTISNVVTYIHTETQHSAFVREGADIRIRGI